MAIAAIAHEEIAGADVLRAEDGNAQSQRFIDDEAPLLLVAGKDKRERLRHLPGDVRCLEKAGKMDPIEGTHSDLAFSFAHYGHEVSGPEVGAIAVMGRRGGGHVGIVTGTDGHGNPIIVSGNHGNRVREAVYPRHRIITFRKP